MIMKRIGFLILVPAFILLSACGNPNGNNSKLSGKNIKIIQREGYSLVSQHHGPDLGYSSESGVSIIYDGGNAFKDLNRNGVLDTYEDWRKSPEKRVQDLLDFLTLEDVAGLMLCSHMQALPGTDMNHYGGKVFRLSGANPWDLTDEQKAFLTKDHTKSVLLAGSRCTEDIVRWVNNVQALAEAQPLGIPVNILSDPRHHTSSEMVFLAGAGGTISKWPNYLGMAATFDPYAEEDFGSIAAAEYRALGITTALSPQADTPGEPRWWRFDGTFGESTQLATDMVRAYCDGFQTSEEKDWIPGAWGKRSVNCMVKHWCGYGAQEGGREAHFPTGNYGVFPTGNLSTFLKPFTEGAFKLKNGTEKASAVMTNYSVLWNQDKECGNVACAYSTYVVRDLLRQDAAYDGVVCTDWDVTFDYDGLVNMPGGYTRNGKCYGVEDLTIAERHLRILEVGGDQFGGCNDIVPVLEAFALMNDKIGKDATSARLRESAGRILLNMFRVGIFENPYSDLENAMKVVGCPEFMERGWYAQLNSIVMLKNENALPQRGRKKVWFPKRHYPSIPGAWGGATQEKTDYPLDTALVSRIYDIAATPEEADFALLMIEEPAIMYGYDAEDAARGGNGYTPISLQYEDYTATEAPAVSIAGGNPYEDFTNRSFKGKTVKTLNRDDMVLVRQTRKAMGSKPVVVCVDVTKPFVPSEIEPYADAVLIAFGIQKQALLEIVDGNYEPQGLLPLVMPASMAAVERQKEDVPGDVESYIDTKGNAWNFGFGLNWNGVINDKRTKKYQVR